MKTNNPSGARTMPRASGAVAEQRSGKVDDAAAATTVVDEGLDQHRKDHRGAGDAGR